MPKNGVKISAVVVIRIIVFLLIGFLLFSAYTRIGEFLMTDKMFIINNVSVESSIQFIDKRPLIELKGRNIFAVDINKFQQRLFAEYPQISHLRVVRELPDRIKVLAKRRDMLLQANIKNKYLLVDTDGISVIYVNSPLGLPTVIGLKDNKLVGKLGHLIMMEPLHTAVNILQRLKQDAVLVNLKVNVIDVVNPAKINLTLANASARIVLDTDHGADKLDVLVMLLNQHKIDLNQIEYVDLRFDQPVISSKPEADTSRRK